MLKQEYERCVGLLKQEMVLALGCTEPSAVAYAGALARKTLGRFPASMEIFCSGNIIKNAKSVKVPNSGGLWGIEAAATLGAVGGDASLALEVLRTVRQEDVEKTRVLLREGFCRCSLLESDSLLHILVRAQGGGECAEVELRDRHTNVIRIAKNGAKLPLEEVCAAGAGEGAAPKYSAEAITLKLIMEFAGAVELEDVREVIEAQIERNSAISWEGLSQGYGVEVGKVLAGSKTGYGRLSAAAAAGSDARMNGCTLPVVINSGSGNQGITVSIPVIMYARERGCSEEQLCRALVLANLLSLHQKFYIGSLSAYCGASCAACSAVCGIAYLDGQGYDVLSKIITNALAAIGGMVCDGAKSSCAMKIAAALQTSFLAYEVAKAGNVYQHGEGIVGSDVEETIRNMGRVARNGMRATDEEILRIMMGH